MFPHTFFRSYGTLFLEKNPTKLDFSPNTRFGNFGIAGMAFSVVEFSREGYKIRKVFG